MDPHAKERIALALARHLPPGVSAAELADVVEDALHGLPSGAELITAERIRQIVGEGWTPQHDLSHEAGTLSRAALAYLQTATAQLQMEAHASPVMSCPSVWPFDEDLWKPQDVVRNLVRAGALIAAEVDRHREANGGVA